MPKTTYKEAGVDINKGEKAIGKIKDLVTSTFTPGVLQEIGGFGGLYLLLIIIEWSLGY